MLILAIIVGGMFVGLLAQLVLGRTTRTADWGLTLIAGIGGSFVGGLLASLLFEDDLALRPSGLIGSFVGALIVTAAVFWFRKRR